MMEISKLESPATWKCSSTAARCSNPSRDTENQEFSVKNELTEVLLTFWIKYILQDSG